MNNMANFLKNLTVWIIFHSFNVCVCVCICVYIYIFIYASQYGEHTLKHKRISKQHFRYLINCRSSYMVSHSQAEMTAPVDAYARTG